MEPGAQLVSHGGCGVGREGSRVHRVRWRGAEGEQPRQLRVTLRPFCVLECPGRTRSLVQPVP